MCSSNIVYSSESARGVRVEKCGEVTQDICVEIVDVNYVCEDDMPITCCTMDGSTSRGSKPRRRRVISRKSSV